MGLSNVSIIGMLLPILTLLLAAQAAQTAQTPAAANPATQPGSQLPAPVPAQQIFATPFVVAEANRIALTPIIDGKIQDEEWDLLGVTADGSKTYFEWEPSKLHAAAVVPIGHDAVFSFDLDSNGWLQGKDNIEVRLSMVAGKPVATVRLLDATTVAGPTWRDLPGFSLAAQVAATADATSTTYEVTLTDPGVGVIPTDEGDKIGIRADDPLSTSPAFEPFIPRVVTPVTLTFSRVAGLPTGLVYRPEGEGKSIVAGEKGRIRLTFSGPKDLKLQRLELRTEGLARNDTNMLAVPFPPLDDKGRAFVDYETGSREGVALGYRVLRGTLTAADGVSALIETSYRLASPIDGTLVIVPTPVAANDRSIRFAYYLHSNSTKPLVGKVSITVPEPLRLVNATPKTVEMETARARLRESFELYIPANTKGTFPFHFTGEAGGKPFDQIGYITIGGI